MAGGQGGHTQHDQLVPPVAVQARRIAFSDLKSQQFLGEGSFGTVYAAQWGTDTVAVKVLHDNRHVPLDVLKRGLKEEVTYLVTASASPSTLRVWGYCDDPLAIVTEYCSGGSLDAVLRAQHTQQHTPPEPDLRNDWGLRMQLLLQLAEGMEYLHDLNPTMLHRDLKPANCMLSEVGPGHWRLKVADFGMATLTHMPTAEGQTAPGLPYYAAPEVLRAEPATKHSDVYSFAMCMYSMLTLQPPFHELIEANQGNAGWPWPLWLRLTSGEPGFRPPLPPPPPALPRDVYRRYTSLMTQCWAETPEERPLFPYIVQYLQTLVSDTPTPRRAPSTASGALWRLPSRGGSLAVHSPTAGGGGGGGGLGTARSAALLRGNSRALGTHRLASLGPELQDFCGRDKEVEEIKELLTTHVAVNIHGSPGEGKTTLARAVAMQLDRDPAQPYAGGIVLIDLTNCKDNMAHVIGKHVLGGTQGTLESASELLEEWLLSLDVHAPVLLVLDNAEDPIKYDGTAFIDVLRLLLGTPPWGAMKLLITCKLCIGLSEYNLYEWKIPAFPAEAGRAMLKAKVGDLVSDEEAHEIVAMCESNPCALRVVIGVLRVRRLTVQEILQAQGNPVDAQGDMTIKETNVRTFISRCLDKLQPHERDALVLLSLFDGDFTEQAAHAVLQPVVVQAGGAYPSETSNGMLWGFSNVWYTLKEWFLVNNTTMTAPTAAATTTPTHHHTTPTNGGGGGGRHGSGGHAPPQQQQQRYKVHLLLRWHAESVLNACWKHAAAQAALPVALQNNTNNHMMQLLQRYQEGQQCYAMYYAQLLTSAGDAYDTNEYWKLQRVAIEEQRNWSVLFAWLNDHKSLGSITNNANTNTNTNTHHKSVVGVGVGGVGVGGVPTQQRVGVPPRVAWEAKRALVCDFMQHLNASKVIVSCYANLSVLEAHLRRFRDVHLLHPDSLQPTLRLTTTGDMSMFGVCVGSSDQADKVMELKVGLSHAINMLARLRYIQSSWDEAITLHKQAYTLQKELYINDNDKMPLAITRLYMAEASRELDQQTDVQAYLNEAKQILDFMYAEKSDPHAGPYLLRVLCAFMQKHREWAEALQRQARRQPYPEARAQQRRAEKHLRDATVCGDEALTIAQELYGADSAQAAVPTMRMAQIHAARGQHDTAEHCFIDAICHAEKTGGNSGLLVICRKEYARYLTDLGHYHAALEQHNKVYEHQVAHLGPDAQQLCSTLKQMAHVCMRLRRFDDAEHYLEECLRIAIKWQGEYDNRVSSHFRALGTVYERRRAFSLAADAYRRAYLIRSENLGEGNELTIEAHQALERALKKKEGTWQGGGRGRGQQINRRRSSSNASLPTVPSLASLGSTSDTMMMLDSPSRPSSAASHRAAFSSMVLHEPRHSTGAGVSAGGVSGGGGTGGGVSGAGAVGNASGGVVPVHGTSTAGVGVQQQQKSTALVGENMGSRYGGRGRQGTSGGTWQPSSGTVTRHGHTTQQGIPQGTYAQQQQQQHSAPMYAATTTKNNSTPHKRNQASTRQSHDGTTGNTTRSDENVHNTVNIPWSTQQSTVNSQQPHGGTPPSRTMSYKAALYSSSPSASHNHDMGTGITHTLPSQAQYRPPVSSPPQAAQSTQAIALQQQQQQPSLTPSDSCAVVQDTCVVQVLPPLPTAVFNVNNEPVLISHKKEDTHNDPLLQSHTSHSIPSVFALAEPGASDDHPVLFFGDFDDDVIPRTMGGGDGAGPPSVGMPRGGGIQRVAPVAMPYDAMHPQAGVGVGVAVGSEAPRGIQQGGIQQGGVQEGSLGVMGSDPIQPMGPEGGRQWTLHPVGGAPGV